MKKVKNNKEEKALVPTTLNHNFLDKTIDLGDGVVVKVNREQEIQRQSEDLRPEPPRLRICHDSDRGKHYKYIDYGESYTRSENEQTENVSEDAKFLIIWDQRIRAIFEKGTPRPICASINDCPTVEDAKHASCVGCPENKMGSSCKPKQRLFVVYKKEDGTYLPLIFNLPTTSLKYWRDHRKKATRDKKALLEFLTVFRLKDVQSESFRWAEVTIEISGGLTEGEVKTVFEFRAMLKQYFEDVGEKDYQEPGDKLDKEKEVPAESKDGKEDLPF